MIHMPGRQDYRVVILIFAFHCGSAFEAAIGGHPETCAVTPSSSDCNGNEVADDCDIGSGMSVDCNENDIPDECEIRRACPPLGEYFTPEHVFGVRPYCFVCDPEGGHYGIDEIREYNLNTGYWRHFRIMPYQFCDVLVGGAISPDGKHFRVGRGVYEFDPRGNMSSAEGIQTGNGSNPIAYDRHGNFYSSLSNGLPSDRSIRVMRYPVSGGPPEVGCILQQ